MNLSIRTSMILFFFSQISGQLIVSHGMAHVLVDGAFVMENIETSTTIGEAGNLKLPHAISLHSIQALPLLGLLLLGLPLTSKHKQYLVLSAAIGFACITAFTQWLAYQGSAIQDVNSAQAGFLGLSLFAFLVPFLAATGIRILSLIKSQQTQFV